MATIYITKQGAMVGKTSERLKITLKKEILLDLPLIKVSEVVLFGNITVTTPAIKLLAQKGIGVTFLNKNGKYICRVQPEISKNSLLRIEQYRAFFDDTRRLEIARGFVLGKLANLRMMLVRKGGKSKDTKAAIERIKKAERRAKTTSSVNMLRGHEGDGSAAYFSAFNRFLKPKTFSFEKRVRRPPTDPVNALLSFGYTLLTNDIITACTIAGFDPYIGYLHAEHYGRPALALDLMEEFRPLIVDAMVMSCINKKILTTGHFKSTETDTCRLTDEGRQAFLEQYEQRRKTEFTHAALEQKMTYQQAFEEQARLLGKLLQGEREDYPPLLMK